jgi:MFS family permease
MFLVWLGQALSQMGTRMYQIALIWWLAVHAGAAGGRAAGLFMVASALPSLLLVKAIGRIIDRGPVRPVLVRCDLLSALVVSCVAAALRYGLLGIASACFAGLAVAALAACFDPALNKAVAELAPPDELPEAVAWQSSTQSLASFAGAMAGAVLIDRIGLTGVAVVNAASFLVSAACNAVLPLRAAAAGKTHAPARAGWAILSCAPALKRVLIGFGFVNFFMTPILVTLPLYTARVLHAPASTLGRLEAALWLGLLSGTLSAGRRRSAAALRTGAVCMAVIGSCFILPGIFAGKTLLAASLCAAGAALGVNNVTFMALFQEKVPGALKGRFFALLQAVIGFTFPAAYLLSGVLLDGIGPLNVLLAQGLGILGLSVYFLRLSAGSEPLCAPLEAGA